MRTELSKDEYQRFINWLRQDISNNEEKIESMVREYGESFSEVGSSHSPRAIATSMAIQHAREEIAASLTMIQKLKGIGDNNAPTVEAVCGGGLGYVSWLRLNRDGDTSRIMLPCGKLLAVCHAPLVATKEYAQIIDGVEIGDWICGVRRTEKRDTQSVTS